MALISSANRPNTWLKAIDKRTCGWKRRNEALDKKTTALLQMVDRVWNQGIDASFVLFDRGSTIYAQAAVATGSEEKDLLVMR